jgi:thymidylate synthase
MNNEQTYQNLLRKVLEEGEEREDRTGVGTISLFSPPECRYDLREGFPLLTTKSLAGKRWEGIVRELLWFLSGSTNCRELEKYNIPIWSAWSNPDGSLGRIYGAQWRSWKTYEKVEESRTFYREGQPIDQIANLVKGLKEDPFSRRHIVSAWNIGELDQMNLPPCHFAWQCYVSKDSYLDLKLTQRSQDLFLGASYNIASYSLLLTMLAQVTNLIPRYFILSTGDTHIYQNHIDQVKEQLSREPRNPPRLVLNSSIKNIDDFTYDDIRLEDYNPWPTIKAPVAV